MNCNDCLKALQTESLREMSPDSPVMRHCATCPDCARVTTMLRDKEYETATVLNNLPPMSNPLTVAGTAVHTAQRRRVGRVVVMLSGVAGAIIIWIVAAQMIVLPMQRAGIIGDNDRQRSQSVARTETMKLSCLSPEQAGEIIEPYLLSNNSTYYVSGGIPVITVRGTAHELAKARNLIREFDNYPGVACRAPATTGGASPTPEVGVREPTPPSGSTIGKGPSLLDPRGGASLLTPHKPTTPPKK